jgi:hypothetical protein
LDTIHFQVGFEGWVLLKVCIIWNQSQTLRYGFELRNGRPMGWIKILIGEWSRQKIKSYHWVNVDKVSHYARQLRKRGGMLRSLFLTWVKSNLNYGYINSWTPFPYKPVFNSEFYPKFISKWMKIKEEIVLILFLKKKTVKKIQIMKNMTIMKDIWEMIQIYSLSMSFLNSLLNL